MRHGGWVGVILIASFFTLGCLSPGANYPAGANPLTESSIPRGQMEEAVDGQNLPPEKIVTRGVKQQGGAIVATVNGDALLEEEVLLSISQGLADGGNEAARWKHAVNQLVEREVVIQDAVTKLSRNPQARKFLDKLQEMASKEFDRYMRLLRERNKAESEEEFTKLLESQGVSLALLRRQSERNFMALQYMQSRIIPNLDRIGHVQIREYYQTHQDDFQVPDSVEWRDIFISYKPEVSKEETRKLAETILTRAKKGGDFTQLSLEFCHGDGKFRNAEGIGRKKGEIKPRQVEDYLFSMKDGELGPLVEMSTGFHIIQLVKREHAGVRPFDEKVQKQIRDRLRNEAAQFEMKRIVTELKRNAVIEYFDK
ncbi:MAG: hypothetical protein EXR99_12095 [Gemmataceae bacterium]|nr:hypothetical protein [Gemmataceae bacterium]